MALAATMAVAMGSPGESGTEPESPLAVQFTSSMPVENAVAWAASYDVEVQQLSQEWVFGVDDAVTTGFVLDPASGDPASDYRLALSDLFTGLAADLAEEPNVTAADRQQVTDIQAQLAGGSAPVLQMNVMATDAEASAIQSDPAVAEAETPTSSSVMSVEVV